MAGISTNRKVKQMSTPSAALRELYRSLESMPAETPVTWATLAAAVREAEESQSMAEYEDYMGQDL